MFQIFWIQIMLPLKKRKSKYLNLEISELLKESNKLEKKMLKHTKVDLKDKYSR